MPKKKHQRATVRLPKNSAANARAPLKIAAEKASEEWDIYVLLPLEPVLVRALMSVGVKEGIGYLGAGVKGQGVSESGVSESASQGVRESGSQESGVRSQESGVRGVRKLG